MNESQETKKVEIQVLPLATISISPAGVWFAELVMVDKGEVRTMQLSGFNVTTLLATLRPKLQKNKAYFVQVANKSLEDLTKEPDSKEE